MDSMTLGGASAAVEQTAVSGAAPATPATPNEILLKDYRPRSIYKIPKTDIKSIP
jgi:hypothetical protein